MKTYTIKQKMSNSGSIHDIASDQFDREIRFPDGCEYAVVLAAYYAVGDKGYTTHRTAEAAIRRSKQISECSHKIIDGYGNEYVIKEKAWLVKECNR